MAQAGGADPDPQLTRAGGGQAHLLDGRGRAPAAYHERPHRLTAGSGRGTGGAATGSMASFEGGDRLWVLDATPDRLGADADPRRRPPEDRGHLA
ncbi:hypothetical protein TPA0908_37290 [Micromonospora sp. AKA38]|nr:hypothetical protein TPA0908_37290 [Micromonospora sp. AKA38]